MKLVLGLAAGALMLFQANANAQDMQAGQQACGNDVFALCQQDIPDQGRIAACLRANYSKVSPACRSFMASYGKGKKGSRTASRHHHRHASHYNRHHHYSSRHHRKHRSDEG
jgi:hypothetical protein